MIWPDHSVWAIILTHPFEPIDLKKMDRCSLSLGLGLRYNIFVLQRYVWYHIFYVVVHRVVFLSNTGIVISAKNSILSIAKTSAPHQ